MRDDAEMPGANPRGPRRLLVTGFFDWRGLGDPPALHRLRDNPSGQLVGTPGMPGPLRGALDDAWCVRHRCHIEWMVLPVVWGVASTLALSGFDVAVHLGLGVYDRDDEIYLERGAINWREGVDANGYEVRGVVDEARAAREICHPAPWVAGVLDDWSDTRRAGFSFVSRPARATNVFLCNETHHRSLTHAGGLGGGAVFVHVPVPAPGRLVALAGAVAQLCEALVLVSPDTRGARAHARSDPGT